MRGPQAPSTQAASTPSVSVGAASSAAGPSTATTNATPSVSRPKRTPKPVTPRMSSSSAHAGPSRTRPPTSESKKIRTTFTSARSYPEANSLPLPSTSHTPVVEPEGELQRSQRRSKVEAINKIDRAGTPVQPISGPAATSFLPPPPPPAGPSILRNPLHRPTVVNPAFDISTVRTRAPRHVEPRSAPRLFGLETCPTFYPTSEEFLDPMEYITSLSPHAKQYGICKIVPPEGWQMPFSLPTETFRFQTRLQTINSLEAASRAKVNFLEQLTMFHHQQGDSSVTIPMIDRRPLDLWRLRKEVHKAGGPFELNRVKGWEDLAQALGYDRIYHGAIKSAYQRIIKPFDDFVLRAKASLSTGSPSTPMSDMAHSKPPGFGDSPASPTRSRMSGMRSVKRVEVRPETSPLPTSVSLPTNLGSLMDDASLPLTTPKIKVPGFSSRDGSESELSEEELSPARSTRSAPAREEPSAPTPYVKGDVCEICRGGHAAPKILLCDGCDRGFHIYCLDPPLSAVPTNEEWYCTTCLLGQGDDFGFEEGDEHSIPSFQARDAAFAYAWWNKNRPIPSTSTIPQMARMFGKVAVTEDDVEREFWRLTESATDSVEVEYGADVHSTTHGSAGPTRETDPLDPYSADPWNLNNMPILKESLLRYIKSDISGMTVPWIYLGMLFSAFCWHNEDHYTYSVNYMHWGETKTWYGIPGSDAEKFEEAIKSEAPELFEQQPALLYQLVTMMNPGRLKEAGVRVVACDQRPNEFVITWPKAYHCGFNHGINFNEAVNFALPDWLPSGQECIMRYKHFAKPPVFSHDELLITITLFSDTIKTALWLKNSLAEMVEEETARRERIRNDTPLLTEVLVEEDCPEEQYQCCVCKCFSYLSQVTCTCTKLVACIDHAEQLCACPATKRTLRKRYSENQLEEIYAAVEARASIPTSWRTRLDHLLETHARPPLKSMRALLADGERISHPMPEVDDLREFVTRANAWVEKVTTLTNRKATGRRRKGRQEEEEDHDRTPSAISDLIKQAMSLAFDSPEIPQLRHLFQSIEGFRSEASLIMSTPEDELDLEKCRTALILGNSLNIDLPEIAKLTMIIHRLEWFKKVEEEIDDRTLSYAEVLELLNDADECEIPADHPSVQELRQRGEKGKAWKASIDNLFRSPRIAINDLSALIEGQELTPTDLDLMRQLENMRKQAQNWQSSAITFLSGFGTANAAARLCKAVTTASGPMSRLYIPEIAELQDELDFHAKWLKQLGNFLSTAPNKLGATLTTIYRSVDVLLNPEDDIPSDRFSCFCRGGPAPVMLTCQNCQGSYHPKCVGLTAKQLDRPFVCAMCDTALADDRPSLNVLAGFAETTRWNFILPPQELATLEGIVQICLRFSKIVLQVADPLNEVDPCRDTAKITHLARKMYNLPVVFDAWNAESNQRVVFEAWLRKRWFDARMLAARSLQNGKTNGTSNSTKGKSANGIGNGNGDPATGNGNANGNANDNPSGGKAKGPGRSRRPKLILAQAKEGQFACICDDHPPLDHLLQVKCGKCGQGYHASCVKAPLEAMAPDAKWRCPCCTVKEGKLYAKGVEIRVQLSEHLGTDTYVDYRPTVTTFVPSPVLITLPPGASTPEHIIHLECISFIPPVMPEPKEKDESANPDNMDKRASVPDNKDKRASPNGIGHNDEDEAARKKRKIETDFPSPAGLPAPVAAMSNGNGRGNATGTGFGQMRPHESYRPSPSSHLATPRSIFDTPLGGSRPNAINSHPFYRTTATPNINPFASTLSNWVLGLSQSPVAPVPQQSYRPAQVRAPMSGSAQQSRHDVNGAIASPTTAARTNVNSNPIFGTSAFQRPYHSPSIPTSTPGWTSGQPVDRYVPPSQAPSANGMSFQSASSSTTMPQREVPGQISSSSSVPSPDPEKIRREAEIAQMLEVRRKKQEEAMRMYEEARKRAERIVDGVRGDKGDVAVGGGAGTSTGYGGIASGSGSGAMPSAGAGTGASNGEVGRPETVRPVDKVGY